MELQEIDSPHVNSKNNQDVPKLSFASLLQEKKNNNKGFGALKSDGSDSDKLLSDKALFVGGKLLGNLKIGLSKIDENQEKEVVVMKKDNAESRKEDSSKEGLIIPSFANVNDSAKNVTEVFESATFRKNSRDLDELSQESPGKSVFGSKNTFFNLKLIDTPGNPDKSKDESKDESKIDNKDESISPIVKVYSPQENVKIQNSPGNSNEKFKSISDERIKSVESKNVSESNPDEKIRESIASSDLEKQAVGVRLPAMRLSELAIIAGSSQTIGPSRMQVLVESLPHIEEESPKKLFRIQIPNPCNMVKNDLEPFFPIVISKDLVITDYSNRPMSPRIESSRPKYRSIKSQKHIYIKDFYIPAIPNCFQKPESNHLNSLNQLIPLNQVNSLNPFNIADSFVSIQANQKIEVYAENINTENQEENMQELNMNINSDDLGFLSLNSASKIFDTAKFKESEENNKENETIKSQLNNSPENLMMTPELELESYKVDTELYEYMPSSPNFQNNRIRSKTPNDSVRYNCVAHIDHEDSYNRMSSPMILYQNRLSYPEYSENSMVLHNESYHKDSGELYRPAIKVFGAESSEKSPKNQDNRESFNISNIRMSLNNSGIYSKNNKIHYLRKSPKRLPPELYERNLQGKLTADEELLLTDQ